MAIIASKLRGEKTVASDFAAGDRDLLPDSKSRTAANKLRRSVTHRVLDPDLPPRSRSLVLQGDPLPLYAEGKAWVDVDALETTTAAARRSM